MLNILFAAQRKRGQMKGTDQLEPLFDRLAAAYPDRIRLTKVQSVPFSQYQRLVAEADVVVDQLYSFTPAMAALESMSQGKLVISGYEPEYQQFILASQPSVDGAVTAPLLNLRPFEDEANYRLLEQTLLDTRRVTDMKEAAQQFVRRHHDADQVAARYVAVWQGALSSSSSRPSQR